MSGASGSLWTYHYKHTRLENFITRTGNNFDWVRNAAGVRG